MPCAAWNALSAGWENSGWSSTWFTAGTTPVASIRVCRCSGSKLDTPIDRALPLLPKLDHRLPAVDVQLPPRQRPVDEEQVDVLEAEALEALVQSAEHGRSSVVRPAELRGDEELAAWQSRRSERRPDLSLVLVAGGGVDEPEAHLEGRQDGPRRFLPGERPGSEANRRKGLHPNES